MPCTAIESRRMLSVLCGEGDGCGSNVPAVQVVLFQFFLFWGGPACYFPEARAPVVLVPAG
jgi:hypothetical protein